MSRVLKNKIQILRENLMTCFREALPSRQFNAMLSLSAIWLHVLVDREAKSKDPEERRCITNEFDQCKRSLTRGIEVLYEQTT